MIAYRLSIPVSEAERFLLAHNELIAEIIKKDTKVATGLGLFSRSHRKARVGVNLRKPSEKITIPALITSKFKASETFKKAIK